MTTPAIPQKWERMPNEHPRAFASFMVYLQLGVDRSIDKAYRMATGEPQGSTKRASGRWRTWASDWGWMSRAGAWDDFLASETRRGMMQVDIENAKIRIRNLTNAQNLAMVILGKVDASNLSPTDARNILPQALRALEMTVDSLREEFGVGARPTTDRSLQVTADVSGTENIKDLDTDTLIKGILAEAQGIDIDTLDEYRVSGQGSLVRRTILGSPESNGIR